LNETLSICVAIPVTNFETAIQTAKDAVKQRAQFIEFRVDYAPDVTQWSTAKFRQLVESVSIPTILTMRMKSEGGQQELEEETRIEILKKIILAKPTYVDLEVHSPAQTLQTLYQLCLEKQVKRIYSLHNFQMTPNDIETQTIINQIRAHCPGLNDPLDEDSVIKLIFFARCQRDNLVVLDVCQNMTHFKRKIICFCMGEKGIYSRVMCLKSGALLSYASLTESTAPGQISISKFYEFIDGYKAENANFLIDNDPDCN